MALTVHTPGTKIKATEINANNNFLLGLINGLGTDYSNFINKDGSIKFTKEQSYATSTISNVTNATPIVVISNGHNRSTGEKTFINGVLNSDGGRSAANGEWTITKIDANSFSLNNSVGNGTYASGGIVYFLPTNLENLAPIAYIEKASEVLPLGTVSANFTLTMDRICTASITASCTLALPTGTSTKYRYCMIDFSLASTASLTLPTVGTSFKWKYGVVPTLVTTEGVRNQLFFESFDGGTTWIGSYVQIGA